MEMGLKLKWLKDDQKFGGVSVYLQNPWHDLSTDKAPTISSKMHSTDAGYYSTTPKLNRSA